MGGWRGCCVVLVVLACSASRGWAERQWLLCEDGEGRFEAQFRTGVTVLVEAAKSGGLASRRCSAELRWGETSLAVTPTDAQVDVDVLGADLGLGGPAVAFVLRSADDEWRARYSIYSLEKPARPPRTITGGDNYSAEDADFDGRIAIWTGDGAAVEGFDQLRYADFDFAPTVVLAFRRGQLMDVGAEYPARYDKQIAQVRSTLDAQSLRDFKQSDGALLDGSTAPATLVRLRKTKVKVLEIVWSYLNSGRQERSWRELTEDWPASDVARVRAAIVEARGKGIDAQVEGVEESGRRFHRGRPMIFEAGAKVAKQGDHYLPGLTSMSAPTDSDDQEELVVPQPIFLRRSKVQAEQEEIELVIDAAGKVQRATMAGGAKDAEAIEAAKGWKFIPAFKSGQPVACRYLMQMFPLR